MVLLFLEDSPLELSVVNPGFIVGPPLMKMDCTSIEVSLRLDII